VLTGHLIKVKKIVPTQAATYKIIVPAARHYFLRAPQFDHLGDPSAKEAAPKKS